MGINKPKGPKEIKQSPEVGSLSSVQAMKNSLRKNIFRVLMLTIGSVPMISCGGPDSIDHERRTNNVQVSVKKDYEKVMDPPTQEKKDNKESKEVCDKPDNKNMMLQKYGLPRIVSKVSKDKGIHWMIADYTPSSSEVTHMTISYECDGPSKGKCYGEKTFDLSNENLTNILLVKNLDSNDEVKLHYKFIVNGKEVSFTDRKKSYNEQEKVYEDDDF